MHPNVKILVDIIAVYIYYIIDHNQYIQSNSKIARTFFLWQRSSSYFDLVRMTGLALQQAHRHFLSFFLDLLCASVQCTARRSRVRAGSACQIQKPYIQTEQKGCRLRSFKCGGEGVYFVVNDRSRRHEERAQDAPLSSVRCGWQELPLQRAQRADLYISQAHA